MRAKSIIASAGTADTKHSAVRALLVLESVNRRSSAYVREIATDTGCSKPTVVRLLHMLVQAGYVVPCGQGGRYAPASRVTALSCGYRPSNAVVEAARPLMRQFTAEHVWPLALGLVEKGAMVVHHSTTPDSRTAWYPDTRGARLSLTNSAMGLAMLAFLPPDVAASVLDSADTEVEFATPTLARDSVHAAMEQVRMQGYAVRRPSSEHPTTTLSVPVLARDQPLAALSITFFGRQMTAELVASRFAPALKQLAAHVAAEAAT